MRADESMRGSTPETQPVLASGVIVASGPNGVMLAPTLGEPAESARDRGGEASGPEIEGEASVWEGHYSFKNFLGRAALGVLLIVFWLYLAVESWGLGRGAGGFWTTLLGVGLLAFWGSLAFKYCRAYRSHHYRLTTRRLLVTTGFFRRRVDQVELVRINDVYVQQTMIGDWLGVGSVVVVSSERTLPKALLLGIEDPRRVMDLVWHYMRIEQNQKTTRINPV